MKKKLITEEVFRLMISILLLVTPGVLALTKEFSSPLSSWCLAVLVFSVIAAFMLFLFDLFSSSRVKHRNA